MTTVLKIVKKFCETLDTKYLTKLDKIDGKYGKLFLKYANEAKTHRAAKVVIKHYEKKPMKQKCTICKRVRFGSKYCIPHLKKLIKSNDGPDLVKAIRVEEKSGKYRDFNNAPTIRKVVRDTYQREHTIHPKKGKKYKLTIGDNTITMRRVVTGDHGAYIECNAKDLKNVELEVQPGEERRHPNNPYIKYLWLRIKGTNIKVYHQLRTVRYADYRPNYYYIDARVVNMTDI